ncbi:MAG TPA: serine/threonine-protein kinase [Kofleriaceae bacterium]|jgi:serine/threonine-protein kinase
MTRLGRYEIVKSLARGGMAELLLARATGMQAFERHVVVKRIRPDLAEDTRFVQMFLEEARLAASLHHQHIVQVHDVGEQDGAYFFAMEYVHGEDLRAIIEKVGERHQLVPVEIVCQIIAAAAAGLHHAHEKVGPDRQPLGLVHRDVSPGNVLVGYDGGVKLVDFGLAKAALRSAATTRAGTLKGKAGYMSPEQCRGVPLDRRSDVFTLGIVLYELLTARRVFKAANDYLTMTAIVQSDVPPPSSHRSDIPRELDEIVLRALAKEPGARYQSADELRDALERYMTEAQLRSSPKRLADYMRGLFGERPEPWLVPREPRLAPTATPSTGSGIVEPPASIEATIVTAQSPLALAHALAKEQNEFIEDGATILAPPPDFTGEVDEETVTLAKSSPLDDAPTTIAPPPIAIAPAETPPPPITLTARVRSAAVHPLAVAGAALAALIVVAIAFATCGRDDQPAGFQLGIDAATAIVPDPHPAPAKPTKPPPRLR